MDAGTWMYNMEWLGDHALAAEALLHCGHADEAKLLIEKNLRDSIGPDGRTIESGRWFGYDYTEINQNGMMLFAIWNYLCWTGDDRLIRKYWSKVSLCADFPLKEVFLNAKTHMVRNKREFWERSDSYGIMDGYELAYQFWVSFGLEKAALVARHLGDLKAAGRWRSASRRMRTAMLEDPTFRLVEDGHLIKRRTGDGEWQRVAIPPRRSALPPGSPIATEEEPSLEPDAITVLPIVYEMIDPASALSKETLRWVESLWNQKWSSGGYPRYNVTSEDNPPAPWPIPSMIIARANAAAGEDERVWRVLDWLYGVAGTSGSWFERYGQSITPPMPPVGVVGWIWYEVVALCSYHLAGFRPELDLLTVRPGLLKEMNEVHTSHVVRGSRVELTIRREGGRQRARVNGKEAEVSDGKLKLTYPRKGSTLFIEMTV
jgi:GH15 family glucan-1,4-alpha-glucosidase